MPGFAALGFKVVDLCGLPSPPGGKNDESILVGPRALYLSHTVCCVGWGFLWLCWGLYCFFLFARECVAHGPAPHLERIVFLLVFLLVDQLPIGGGVVSLCILKDVHTNFGGSNPPWSVLFCLICAIEI